MKIEYLAEDLIASGRVFHKLAALRRKNCRRFSFFKERSLNIFVAT